MDLSKWVSDGQSVGVDISEIAKNTELASYHPEVKASFSVKTMQINDTQIKMYPVDANGNASGSWSNLAVDLMDKLVFEQVTEDGQTCLKAANVQDCFGDVPSFDLLEWKIYKQRYVDKWGHVYENAFVDELRWDVNIEGLRQVLKSNWTWTRVKPQ